MIGFSIGDEMSFDQNKPISVSVWQSVTALCSELQRTFGDDGMPSADIQRLWAEWLTEDPIDDGVLQAAGSAWIKYYQRWPSFNEIIRVSSIIAAGGVFEGPIPSANDDAAVLLIKYMAATGLPRQQWENILGIAHAAVCVGNYHNKTVSWDYQLQEASGSVRVYMNCMKEELDFARAEKGVFSAVIGLIDKHI